MPRILTGVSGVCSAKPTERMKPGCTPVSHVTSGVGVPPGGTTGCAHAWHGIANAMQVATRSEAHTSELQSLMRISYAVFCLKKKKTHNSDPPHTSRPRP